MKILKSKKGIPIPTLFFVSNRDEIQKVPKGVPYFFGAEDTEDYIVRILEYEVLYQKAISTSLPFNFKDILKLQGFSGIDDCKEEDVKTSFGLNHGQDIDSNRLIDNKDAFINHISSGNYYVDIGIIKSLNIFPIWLNVLEDAISSNIHKYATFDTNMYNKKLEGMYGGVRLESPNKNLIIIDVSGSIPRQVSSTILVLAQNMSLAFYADILITGSTSTLYPYEKVQDLDIDSIYRKNGTSNDQVVFKKLITSSEKHYNTLIVFGDEDYPGYPWTNEFNNGSIRISEEEGKSLNKWTVDKIVAFHTCPDSNYVMDQSGRHWVDKMPENRVPGYGRWFSSGDVTCIKDWVKDMDDES